MTQKHLPARLWTPRNSLRLEIEEVPIHALKRNAGNPRIHPEKQIAMLARMINMVGYLVPCIIDQHNRLVNGHARVEAAERVGMLTVPCIRVCHLSDLDKRALAIADAKVTEGAAWNIEVLRGELRFFSDLRIDFDFSAIGFETDEVDRLLHVPGCEGDDAPNNNAGVGVPEKQAVSRLGDLWQADFHRIACADPLTASSYGALLGDARARLVMADPPDGLYVGGPRPDPCAEARDGTAVLGPAKGRECTALATFLTNLAAASCDGALHYLGTDWKRHDALVKAGGAVYSELMDRCVWCKPNAGRGPLYRAAHDLVLVFKNGTAPHVDNINVGPHRRDRSNVWSYPESALLDHRRKGRGPAHANTKPVALATDIIMDASGHGDLIVGVFASAATTLLAAERTRRRAAILDVDPRRVDRLIRRWQALTGKKAVCTRSGATFAERDASSTTCEADPSRSTASGGVHS